MPATLDPPAAPAAPVTPAADRTAIPATDYVKPSAVPVEPPKKGSRMETLYKDLEKKAKPASGEETTPAAPTKPADKPDQRPGSDTTTTTDAPEVTTDQPATPTSEAGDKGKKTTLGLWGMKKV